MALMRNTKMTDAWITEAVKNNPIQMIMDPQTGQPTGNIRTCPVRLSFVDVFTPKANKQNPNAQAKFGSDLLFPPIVDFTVLAAAYYDAVRRLFPTHTIRQDGTIFEPYPLHSPWKAQASKLKYNGYTDGGTFITTSTKFKLPVVDGAMNPIVDPARVYPGVWAIAALNTYHYGVSPPQPKKGIGFGLLTLMIVQDDENTGGGGQADPNKVFAGVVNANFNAPAAFGVPGAQPGLLPPGGALAGGAQGFQTQPLPGAEVDASSLY